MTTYYEARQRDSDKRWDFTSSTGSGGTCPIGYCAGWREMTAHDVARFGEGFAQSLHNEIEAKRVHQAKYHKDGHATAEEACACYREWELDNDLKFFTKPIEEAKELHRCAECQEFTAGLACLGQHRNWYLCDAHRNRETVEKLAREP